METIKSFTVDHKRLLPGVYVSRKDSTGHDVVTTIANGKVLMKDRELTGIDEAKVMADCRQAAGGLSEDING